MPSLLLLILYNTVFLCFLIYNTQTYDDLLKWRCFSQCHLQIIDRKLAIEQLRSFRFAYRQGCFPLQIPYYYSSFFSVSSQYVAYSLSLLFLQHSTFAILSAILMLRQQGHRDKMVEREIHAVIGGPPGCVSMCVNMSVCVRVCVCVCVCH